MSNNQFKPFATGNGANVLTPAQYENLAALVSGFQSGIASSQQVNTPLRQATFVAAAIGQIIANSGADALDDGNLTSFVNKLMNAVATSAGMIGYFAASSAPSGWLKCNGTIVSRATYSNLFSAIGTLYGSGDGSTTFALPDLRGEFLRGLDDGRGIDPSRTIGSKQKGTVVPGYDDNSAIYEASRLLGPASIWSGDLVSYDNTPEIINMAAFHSPNASDSMVLINPTTYPSCSSWFNIARPRNIALLPCIKF